MLGCLWGPGYSCDDELRADRQAVLTPTPTLHSSSSLHDHFHILDSSPPLSTPTCRSRALIRLIPLTKLGYNMNARQYCCCAIPLLRSGIYAVLAEQTILAFTVGVLALATPHSNSNI